MEKQIYTTEEGNKLQYYVFGGGSPLIVMIHAQSTSSESYFGVAEKLAKSNKVILVDCYGHGGSSHKAELYKLDAIGDDICALIKSLTDEKITLVGHSSGGLIAAYIASKYPCCEKLVLEDPPFFASSGERRYKTFNYLDLSSVCHRYLEQRETGDFVLYYFGHQYAWNFFPEKDREKIKTALTKNAAKYRSRHPHKPLKVIFWPKAALEAFRGMDDYDPSFGEAFYSDSFHAHIDYDALLKEIKCQTVFLKAKTDIDENGLQMCALTDEDVERLAALIPNFQVVNLDCGHSVHTEKEKEFLSVFG